MIEACYAQRGRDRAIVLVEGSARVVVPLRDPAGGNTRCGDVTIPRADLPVVLASKRPLVARCSRAAPPSRGDAWRWVGSVPASLARRVVDEMRRTLATRAVEARHMHAPTERAVRM